MLAYECLMSCILITWISYHMHHIDICLENGYFLTKNQNSLSIGHKKKERGIQLEKARKWSRMKIYAKMESQKALTKWSTSLGLINGFVEVGSFKTLPRFIFCIVSSGSSRGFVAIRVWKRFWGYFLLIELSWTRIYKSRTDLEVRVLVFGYLLSPPELHFFFPYFF